MIRACCYALCWLVAWTGLAVLARWRENRDA